MRLLIVVALVVAACDPDGAEPAPAEASTSASAELLEAAEEQAPVDAGQQTGAAEKAGERVSIPAGRFLAGSTPGDRGREPSLEPALLPVELNAFEIDRLPYPNDPSAEPLTGIPRDKAAALCGERGGRLCAELEWERACKGPEQTPYAGSQAFSPRCAREPATCASGFGVLGMGAALREWTASEVEAIKKWQAAAAAVRGSKADAADVDHRCAHRMAVAPDVSDGDLGFRCCYGEPNKPAIPSPQWQAAFRPADMPPARLAELFSNNARLKPLAKDIKYFHQAATADTILRRAAARGVDAAALPAGSEVSTAPLLWNPVPGEEIVLATGRSGDDSFIVAFHRLPNDRYRVGAALILKGELGPIALVYDKNMRQKLVWTTCWECFGETGNIRYRSENRVTITQK